MALDKYGQVDYAALIKDAITQKKGDSYIQTLAAGRDAKIAGSPDYSGTQSTQSYMDSLGYKPQVPEFDIQGEMDKLKVAQMAQSVAGLDKQKAGSLSNLSVEQAKIQPAAYNDRNSANATMNNSKQSWNDFLAAKGLMSSGVAGQGYMNTQNAYQGEVGSINRDATAKEGDINRRTTDINNAYLSDLEAGRTGIEATSLQNTINQMNADRTFNANQTQNTFNNGIQTAGLLGNYQGQQTMAAKQNDTQNNQWQQTYDMNKTASDLNNQLTQADIDELKNPNSITNKLARLGLDTAQFNYSQLSVTAKQQAQQVANDLANGVMSRAQAQSSINHAGDSLAASKYSTNASSAANANSLALDQAKFDYSKATPADMTDAQIIDSNTGYIVGVMNGYSTPAEKLNYLQKNSKSIINDIGYDVYSKLAAGVGG